MFCLPCKAKFYVSIESGKIIDWGTGGKDVDIFEDLKVKCRKKLA